MSTLGALPPNEKDILKRGGRYGMKAPNAIPGGGAMPLDRKKNKERATSYSSQARLTALQKTGNSHVDAGLAFGQMPNYDGAERSVSGTSIFDPVLCELIYRWFVPTSGLVVDPFAGGSVRGIVAGYLGLKYKGVDLRPEQIAANKEQADVITCKEKPEWVEGDSQDIATLLPDTQADFIFSCPPYADLERYSDDPRDISTMEYAQFLAVYRHIIAESVKLLKPDSFACFVVGDVRDDKGNYRNFVSDTIAAFIDAGMTLYNEAILITCVGSLPIRVGRQFGSYRKLGKTHQNVLVFLKGDMKTACAKLSPPEFGEVIEADQPET